MLHSRNIDGMGWPDRPAQRHSGMSSITTTHDRKAVRRHAHRAGLRTVALVEALKGALALVGAYVFIRMIRHDVDFGDAAEHILFFFHINPTRHLSHQFLDAVEKLSSISIGIFGCFSVVDAAL